MDSTGISATLAGNGGDDRNPFKSNPYFRAAANSKSLGKLTKAKDLPRSDADPNQPFYHEHAVLSQAAYDPVKFRNGYQDLGYEVDGELSQKSRTVFYNKTKKTAVIAYKGTHPSHISDLIADGQIFNGMDQYLSGRFRGAEKVYRQAVGKYGKDHVQVTGHSLGGSQAVHVGRKYGAVGTAFEPGAGPAGAFRRARQDIGDVASGKLLGLIHKGFKNAFADDKHTRVQIVGSAYKPRPAVGKDRYANLFHQAEYGISALFHLPGAEKRTWVKPCYKDNHTIKNFV